MRLASRLVYAVLFQIGWLVSVCLADSAALTFALAFALFHLSYVKITQASCKPGREACWIILVGLLGYAMETVFFCAGFLYQEDPPGLFARFNLPPVWLFALWLCFSIALRTCFSFIFRFPLPGSCLIALTVPASYVAGTYLNNNVHINKPYGLSLLLITLSWLIFLALLHRIKHRYFEDIFNDR